MPMARQKTGHRHLSRSHSLFGRAAIPRPGHAQSRGRHAQKLSRMREHRRSRLVLDGFEHGGILRYAGVDQLSVDAVVQLLYPIPASIYGSWQALTALSHRI